MKVNVSGSNNAVARATRSVVIGTQWPHARLASAKIVDSEETSAGRATRASVVPCSIGTFTALLTQIRDSSLTVKSRNVMKSITYNGLFNENEILMKSTLPAVPRVTKH